MTGPVDVQVAVVFDSGPHTDRGFDAAQHSADAGLNDLGTGGFDDVVVRTGLQADDDVHVVAERGEHDDRQLAGRAYPAAHLDTVHHGQHQIEQQEVGAEHVQRLQAGLAGRGGEDLVPAPAQPHLDAVAYGRIIFDEDDAWHAGISRSWDGKVVEGDVW